MPRSNPLYSLEQPACWQSDGSKNGSLSVSATNTTNTTSSNTLTIDMAQSGTPFNVMLDTKNQTATSDELYYEVNIQEMDKTRNSSLALGLVQKSDFLSGWKTKGMFYNGNLTNGSAGLLIGFAPGGSGYPKQGDTVGVRWKINSTEDTIQVAFYQNQQCLGVGFQLSNSAEMGTLYPCLHINGKVVVEYKAPAVLPEGDLERQPDTYEDPFLGNWKLAELFSGPEQNAFPIPPDTTFPVVMGGSSPDYHLSVKIANNLRGSVTSTGRNEEGFDTIKMGPIMSTMMMPPPPLQPLETFLNGALPTLYKMIVSDGNLELKGPEVQMKCSRDDKKFEFLTEY